MKKENFKENKLKKKIIKKVQIWNSIIRKHKKNFEIIIYHIYIEQRYISLLFLNEKCIFWKYIFGGDKHECGKNENSPWIYISSCFGYNHVLSLFHNDNFWKF